MFICCSYHITLSVYRFCNIDVNHPIITLIFVGLVNKSNVISFLYHLYWRIKTSDLSNEHTISKREKPFQLYLQKIIPFTLRLYGQTKDHGIFHCSYRGKNTEV